MNNATVTILEARCRFMSGKHHRVNTYHLIDTAKIVEKIPNIPTKAPLTLDSDTESMTHRGTSLSESCQPHQTCPEQEHCIAKRHHHSCEAHARNGYPLTSL